MTPTEGIKRQHRRAQAMDAVVAGERCRHDGAPRCSHRRPKLASSADALGRKYRGWRAFVVLILLGLL